MSIVYAIESQSGVRGTLTDAFGLYSSPTISEFIDGVAIQPVPAGQVTGRRGGAVAR
jgi:hypothetical protein